MCFVFGVTSRDLPGVYDLELTYSEKKKAYRLDIETIRHFYNVRDELRYYTGLLDEFTQWMKESNFDTDKIITLNDICHWKARDFRSIEDAYAWFRFMVESYSDKCY